MSGRTNFVQVSNLPPCYSNGLELLNAFSSCGQVQDITAVDPTTVIVSFAMRSQSDYAVFALNNLSIGGSNLMVSKFIPNNSFHNVPASVRLGQYIGQDHHFMDANSFVPWSPAIVASGGLVQKSNFSNNAGAAFPGPSSLHSNPPAPANVTSVHDLITLHTVPWDGLGTDDCGICLCPQDSTSLSLAMCRHTYHRACLEALITNAGKSFIECPTCKKVYGVKTGTMPSSGRISHILHSFSLPGYENCGTIEITFNFGPGIQGPEHPSPGHPYSAHAFPRKGYLPDNREGELALHGIYMAWNQRFLFTIGQSVTTGMQNTITWNDIHMKTRPTGGQHNHGFPDPDYLRNLRDDLSMRGITEAAITSHLGANPGLRTQGSM